MANRHFWNYFIAADITLSAVSPNANSGIGGSTSNDDISPPYPNAVLSRGTAIRYVSHNFPSGSYSWKYDNETEIASESLAGPFYSDETLWYEPITPDYLYCIQRRFDDGSGSAVYIKPAASCWVRGEIDYVSGNDSFSFRWNVTGSATRYNTRSYVWGSATRYPVTSNSASTYVTTDVVETAVSNGTQYRVYEHIGSDNIDPSAVSSPADPRGGQSTTVTVTPSTGKVYDGTVSYRYEYSINGGMSWVLIGTTTETSQQVPIPEGTPSFQARVRAQDDLGFTSSTYVYSEQVTVINNEPPTAPGSISVGQILAGQAVTITLTAATDTDGTVVKYIYERSIDGSGWSQIAEVNALTYTDNVGTEWATVAYRACAVDDDGAAGPYVTGETSTVNEGILYISGPAPDMGTVFAIFTAQIGVGVTGTAASDVTLYVDMDGQCLYDGLVDTGETVPIEIDTRLLSSGEHVIAATASKSGYIQASALFKFSTAAGLAGGGLMMQLSDHTGKAIFPRTVAAAVEGLHVPTAQTVVLSASEWTQDGSRYKQAVSVAAVLQRSPAVFVDCALSDDHDANEAIIEAWGPVMSFKPKQADGSLTFYAAEAPDINIPITVVVL